MKIKILKFGHNKAFDWFYDDIKTMLINSGIKETESILERSKIEYINI